MGDGLTCNLRAILVTDSDSVGDVLTIKGDIVQSSPGEVGSDWVRVSRGVHYHNCAVYRVYDGCCSDRHTYIILGRIILTGSEIYQLLIMPL